jgi:hypothetical protein
MSLTALTSPLVVAVAIVFRNGSRIRLSSLFAATACVALFLTVAVRPLLALNQSIHGTKTLKSAGAEVHTRSDFADYASLLGANFQIPSIQSQRYELPSWLIPFAGTNLVESPDIQACEVRLKNDTEIAVFCQNWKRFPNVRHISVYGDASDSGLQQLSQHPEEAERITSIHLDIGIPPMWLRCFPNVRLLSLYSHGVVGGPETSDLGEISVLEHLDSLLIYGDRFADDNLRRLSNINSISNILMVNTSVTSAGEVEMKQRLKNCSVHFRKR